MSFSTYSVENMINAQGKTWTCEAKARISMRAGKPDVNNCDVTQPDYSRASGSFDLN